MHYDPDVSFRHRGCGCKGEHLDDARRMLRFGTDRSERGEHPLDLQGARALSETRNGRRYLRLLRYYHEKRVKAEKRNLRANKVPTMDRVQ